MSDLPASVHITEEGPREGFQFEKGFIATARKIALIDALSQSGLDHIQIASFVNPKAVPGMADADEVVDGVTPRPGGRSPCVLPLQSDRCTWAILPFNRATSAGAAPTRCRCEISQLANTSGIAISSISRSIVSMLFTSESLNGSNSIAISNPSSRA